MKKYMKVEIPLVLVALLLSLTAFWFEPHLVRSVKNGVDNNVTTEGWPFAVQTTTTGMDVSYVGPYVATSERGLFYDWLVTFAVALAVLNAGWWLVAYFRKPEPPAKPDNPE